MKKYLVAVIILIATNLFAGVIATYKINNKEYKFTDKDLNFYLKEIPAQFRQFILRNKKRFVEDLLIQKFAAIEAKKMKLDQNPEVKKQIQFQIERVLYKNYIKKELKNMKISEKDLKEYYEKHKSQFIEKKQFKYSQLEFKSKKEAEKVYSQIKRGKSFESFLAKYQKNPFAALFQNSYRLADKLPEKLRKVLDSLKIGEVSKPFEYKGKYFILKLKDKKGEKSFTFVQVKDKIKKFLITKKAEDIKNKLKNNFFKKFNVKFIK